MVIECSSCHARFKLADDKVKESGTKVRCTKCREVFTVFPESLPQITPPVVAATPIVTNEKDVVDDDFFALTDKSPFAAEIPLPAVSSPASKEDDWNQEDESTFFSDDAGASDLDAISFDNIEPPVFSVATGKNSKFEFSGDSAFSFTDSSLDGEAEEPYKIAVPTDDQALAAESTSEDLSQSNDVGTDGEFTFSATENLANFSWDEPDATPNEMVEPENTQEAQTAPPDTSFDFSSFSFDDAPPPIGSDINARVETDAQSETTIELSRESETSPEPILIRTPTTEAPKSAPTSSGTRPATRPLRPRLRPKRKGSSRLTFKVILAFFLILTLIYGIMNRAQIQKEYKNIVSGFIENQVRVETTGKIGLVKLSGGYLFNNQEGDLFVIRGEAVNEFKSLRSSVLVRGTIYGENGAILQSQSAYCGNPLKDNSLKKLRFKEIREIMNSELGENLVNLNIEPGKGIPFAIVFNKVPKNIKEFTVEVIDSKAGSK